MITHAVFDVDGVFTNGTFHYNVEKKLLKIFGAHDSDAIKFLKFNGVEVQAITADQRGFDITSARMRDMKLPLQLVQEEERLEFVSNNYPLQTTFFMGDGLHDAPVLQAVAYSACPENGCDLAKEKASYVTKKKGGDGAVLEAIKWMSDNKLVGMTLEEYVYG